MNNETQQITYLSSGSSGLDKDLHGLPKNEYTLVSGGEDTGKSIFCLQFLLAGLNAGERAVLITSESVENVLDQADTLQISLRGYVESNQLIILHQKTQVPGVLINQEQLDRMEDALEAEILPWEPTRMAIDSAMPFISLFHPDFRRTGLLKTLRGFNSMGLTTILTTRMPATSEAMSLKKVLEEHSGCAIHLDEQLRVDGQTQRRLVCRKAKGLAPPYPVFDFSIVSGLGLQIGDANETPLHSPAEEVKMKQPKPAKRALFTAAVANKGPKAATPEKETPSTKPSDNKESETKTATHPPKSPISFMSPPKKEQAAKS